MEILSGKLAVFTVIVLVLVATATVKAETIVIGATDQPLPSMVRAKNQFGLGSILPAVSNTRLVTDIQQYRQALEHHKDDLAGMLEDNKMGAGDAVLTAIMPGGLLYAAYRASQQEQTRKQLAAVNALIDELGEDLVALKAANNEIMIARWP